MENNCELFKLTPLELVEAKLYTLQRIRETEKKILMQKRRIKSKEAELLFHTDFKALGCTNEKMRNAYITTQLKDDNTDLDDYEHILNKQQDDIILINDLLELYRVESLTGADTTMIMDELKGELRMHNALKILELDTSDLKLVDIRASRRHATRVIEEYIGE